VCRDNPPGDVAPVSWPSFPSILLTEYFEGVKASIVEGAVVLTVAILVVGDAGRCSKGSAEDGNGSSEGPESTLAEGIAAYRSILSHACC
jgi:hypothetical protein